MNLCLDIRILYILMSNFKYFLCFFYVFTSCCFTRVKATCILVDFPMTIQR